MTTPDQNEAREALEELLTSAQHAPMEHHDERTGECVQCPWPLHMLSPLEIASAILAAGWRPPLPAPEASDDERGARVAAVTAVGDLDWSPKFGMSDLASAPSDEELANTAIDAYLAARRPPVPADGETEKVTTLEALLALPNGTVVRSSAGTIACRLDEVDGIVFGDNRSFGWNRLALPVRILHRPIPESEGSDRG